MRTSLKILLAGLGVVLLLILALVVAVTLILEPNDYRPYIVDAVQDATGRRFEIEGDLGLELWPCCGVSVGPSRLGSPEDFPEAGFASLAGASLSVRIWPLLTRQEVRVGTVTLNGLSLDLVRLADGTVNWEIAGAGAEPADTGGAAQGSPIDLSVERVVLDGGAVRYRDLEAGQAFTVTGLALDTRLAMTGEQVTVQAPRLSLTVTGTGLPDAADVAVSADRVLAALADDPEATIEALEVDVRTLDSHLRLTGSGRAGATVDLRGDFELDDTSPRAILAALAQPPYEPGDAKALSRLAASGRWTVGSNSAAIEALKLELDQSTLTGNVALEDFERTASRFDLALDRIDLDRYLPATDSTAPDGAAAANATPTEVPLGLLADLPVTGSLRIGELHAAGTQIHELNVSLASRDGQLTSRVEARVLGGSLALEGSGNVAVPSPRLAGTLQVKDLALRPLLADAGVTTADPQVLERFAGTTHWQLTPRTFGLEQMRWTLDDTTLTGSASVSDFDSFATRFDLALDRMNVDAYLPPTAEPGGDAEAEPEAELIPVETLRGLALDGRLRAGELTLLGMNLREVNARITAADGILHLDPLTAKLYGGGYRGTILVDATGARPKLTLDQELSAVQVNDVLKRFFDSDLLGGSLSLKLAGSGTGNTSTELLRGLAANVSFDLADGVYRGTNVLYQVQRARALLKNEPPPDPPANPETPIRALHATGAMADGVLRTKDLTAETDALRLLGSGGINLIDLALDYQFDAQVLKGSADASKLGDVANARIPISLVGPLTGPKVKVDLQGLLTNTVRDTLENKARDALLKRLGGDEPAAGGGAGSDKEAQAAPTKPAQATPDGNAAQSAEPAEKPSTKDLLKRSLRDLLKEPKSKEPANSKDSPNP